MERGAAAARRSSRRSTRAPFKSLKKLRKGEDGVDFIVADTRGLADDLTKEIAEDSDVVFLPTGTSRRRPEADAGAGAQARPTRRRGAHRRRAVEGRPLGAAARQGGRGDRGGGVRAAVRAWPLRDGFQADLDAGRAGREARNPYLREIAERMEEALMQRADAAEPRPSEAAESQSAPLPLAGEGLARPGHSQRRLAPKPRWRGLAAAPRRSGASGHQPTISLPAKNCAISTAAVSGASEPCTEFSPIESAKSLRIVPAAAFSGLVAPITSR